MPSQTNAIRKPAPIFMGLVVSAATSSSSMTVAMRMKWFCTIQPATASRQVIATEVESMIFHSSDMD